ncbi:MAG: amidohydrolase family protein [bacterium]
MKVAIINGYLIQQEKIGNIFINNEIIEDINYDKISYQDLENLKSNGYEVIDAKDLYISPGFIDVHSHSDLTIIANPEACSALYQGVTTIISGNCGFAVSPLYPNTIDSIKTEAQSYNINNLNWYSLKEYLDYIDSLGISINYAYLAGHGQIRAGLFGYNNVKLSDNDLITFKNELSKVLDDGAIGLSLGLIYIPGKFSDTHELIELAKVIKSKNKILTNHMRSESSKLLEAINESIVISKETGVNFEISHLKAAGVAKGKAKDACSLIEKAKLESINIDADQYPYEASNTGLSQVLPDKYLEGSIQDIISNITRDEDKVEQDIESNPHTPWDKIIISEAYNPKLSKYIGLTIDQISKDLKLSPAKTVIYLLKTEEYDLGAIYFLMDENEVDYIALKDYVMVASDSAIRCPNNFSHPHPRTYGTFVKFINKYVKQKKLLTLKQAIYKLSEFPAKKFNIYKRGSIQKGYFADIVIFDLQNLKDNSTYLNPHQYPDGIKYVFVNGKLTLKDKKILNKNGKVLRF